MSSRYSTIRQHEPLRAPAGWNAQEKRFVAQLEEILDDLYSRFGRLREEDMGRPLRESIAKSERGVSELRQDSRSFTAAFESIGTMGTQTGATRIDENGLEVCHSDIAHTTTLAADGMKIRDADGNVVGGVYAVGGEVKSAMQSLMNPKQPGFEVTVAPKDYDGEQYGLHLILYGMDIGQISASPIALRVDAPGQLGLYGIGSAILSGGNVSIVSAGDIELVYNGSQTVKLSELAALLPND